MSYDIDLISRKTGKPMMLKDPFYVHGGTVRAELVDGMLVQAKETEASINITYNYGGYYREATKDEKIFSKKDETGERITGIRAIYGMSAEESIPALLYMVGQIKVNNQDENGEWIVSERTRKRYLDADGNEEKDIIKIIQNKDKYRTVEEKYSISEGDTSYYWNETAANAIKPLLDMVHMATDCVMDDCYWDGD